MKHFLSILALVAVAALVGGCAGSAPDAGPAARGPLAPVSVEYAPATSAALAFDPPVALAGPMPSLDRQGRAPEAFVGYEQAVTSFSYVHQRDEQRNLSPFGSLRRDAYTDTTSVTTR